MSFPLSDIKSKNDIRFYQHSQALLEWIEKYWDVKAEPKGYAAARKNYKDYDGMDDIDEKAISKEFKGHGDGGTVSYNFPVRVSLPHVLYDDCGQGHKPLESLIGAILGYGMLLGERMAEVDETSEANYRLQHASHIFFMSMCHEDDPQIKETYALEIRKILDPKNKQEPYEKFYKEFEGYRNDIYKERFKKALEEALTKSNTLTLYSSKDEKKHYLWGFLWQISRSSQKRYEALLKELPGITITTDKDVFIVERKG
jgi:hypothetical protein